MNKFLLFLFGSLLLVGLYFASYYNSLIKLREEVNSQWAQVESQYQRRLDLIPNLVETVKGVAGQEQKVFGDIAKARQNYAGANTPTQRIEAANQLESALSRLLVIVENYPELKSSESFNTLMAQLEGTENRISVERKRYNEKVKEYNIKIKTFPGNVIAKFLGFEEMPYFESQEGAQTPPKVDFNTK